MRTLNKIVIFLRALRLSYVFLCFTPFIFGYFINYKNFGGAGFGDLSVVVVSLFVIICFYISVVLFDENFAMRPSDKWQRARFLGPASGLLNEERRIFSFKFYFILATAFTFLGVIGVLALNLILGSDFTYVWLLIILFLAWAYQITPPEFNFSSVRFLLGPIIFGPVLVMYGYFARGGVLFFFRPFIFSLPLGFLAMTIFVSKEAAGGKKGEQAGEPNLSAKISKEKAQKVYFLFLVLILASLVIAYIMGIRNIWLSLPLFALFIGLNTGRLLNKDCDDEAVLNKVFYLTVIQYALFYFGMFMVVLI